LSVALTSESLGPNEVEKILWNALRARCITPLYTNYAVSTRRYNRHKKAKQSSGENEPRNVWSGAGEDANELFATLGMDTKDVAVYRPRIYTANQSQHYLWQHDTMQEAAYNTLNPKARLALYSKIGNAFLNASKEKDRRELLYETLALINQGIGSEDFEQRQVIAGLNLYTDVV